MKYTELLEELINESMPLTEEAVLSSWIEDLTFDPSQDAIIMALHSGRAYTIYGMDEDMFDMWTEAPSKGKFWHEYVRDFQQIV